MRRSTKIILKHCVNLISHILILSQIIARQHYIISLRGLPPLNLVIAKYIANTSYFDSGRFITESEDVMALSTRSEVRMCKYNGTKG